MLSPQFMTGKGWVQKGGAKRVLNLISLAKTWKWIRNQDISHHFSFG